MHQEYIKKCLSMKYMANLLFVFVSVPHEKAMTPGGGVKKCSSQVNCKLVFCVSRPEGLPCR
jgi:hypothetical protein